MNTLRSRLARIERRRAVESPPESMADARWEWPGRFARHSPANAALLDRIQAWQAGIYATPILPHSEINLWAIVGCLGLNAGADEYDGQIGFAQSPNEEERVAIALIEDLVEAANRFEAETGHEFPLPRQPG